MGKNFSIECCSTEDERILVSRREDALIVHGDRVIEGGKISRGGSFHRAKSLGLSSRGRRELRLFFASCNNEI